MEKGRRGRSEGSGGGGGHTGGTWEQLGQRCIDGGVGRTGLLLPWVSSLCFLQWVEPIFMPLATGRSFQRDQPGGRAERQLVALRPESGTVSGPSPGRDWMPEREPGRPGGRAGTWVLAVEPECPQRLCGPAPWEGRTHGTAPFPCSLGPSLPSWPTRGRRDRRQSCRRPLLEERRPPSAWGSAGPGAGACEVAGRTQTQGPGLRVGRRR